MNNYSYFFDYPIQENQLVCYWNGVNILGIDKVAPVTDFKKYYQFRYPLFSNNYYSDAKIRECNNDLLREIGRCVNVDICTLLDSDEFIFLCLTRKSVASYNERAGFHFRINHHGCRDTFNKMKDFLMYQLMISPVILENIYNVSYQIFTDNHFTTFPINLMGIGKYSETDIPYAQLYITNNPNTTLGHINQIVKENVIQNTLNIVKALNLDIDLCTMNAFIEFAYSRNAFLCFSGIDIHIDKIKKFKLYFRFKDILSTDEVLNIFSEKIKGISKVSIPYPEDTVDFIALAFVLKEKNEFVFDGVQIYQK